MNLQAINFINLIIFHYFNYMMLKNYDNEYSCCLFSIPPLEYKAQEQLKSSMTQLYEGQNNCVKEAQKKRISLSKLKKKSPNRFRLPSQPKEVAQSQNKIQKAAKCSLSHKNQELKKNIHQSREISRGINLGSVNKDIHNVSKPKSSIIANVLQMKNQFIQKMDSENHQRKKSQNLSKQEKINLEICHCHLCNVKKVSGKTVKSTVNTIKNLVNIKFKSPQKLQFRQVQQSLPIKKQQEPMTNEQNKKQLFKSYLQYKTVDTSMVITLHEVKDDNLYGEKMVTESNHLISTYDTKILEFSKRLKTVQSVIGSQQLENRSVVIETYSPQNFPPNIF